VMPSLVLNYFGQGALLMHDPKAIENPFFLLAPDWALLPLVVLSTVATVIASQAVISGAYSLTSQAIQLGYVPRMKILHTSELAIGQIYVPVVNWMLLFIILCIVIAFKSSDNLAAAYGIAVTATMVITTILACVVMVKVWNWNKFLVAMIIGVFMAVDLGFFGANLLKVAEGGWLPLGIGALLFLPADDLVQGQNDRQGTHGRGRYSVDAVPAGFACASAASRVGYGDLSDRQRFARAGEPAAQPETQQGVA
jgi:KUP system potassium uptake protein